MAFESLPATLAEALSERGYDTATPVQMQVIEPAAEGRDLIVSARTGSGKTIAFGMAMAAQFLDHNGKAVFSIGPAALVIAPTRELAMQVARELEWLYAKAGARIVACVGGMDAMKERRALGQGATIVVGTPGRLRDHLERGALDLSHLKVAVLDEADEMLDMGFREELEEILDATPDGRRTMLFSATMPRPIVALAKRYQNDALRISTVDDNRGHGDIAYQAVAVAPSDIEHAVINILRLHEAETAMLFCATRDNVRHLSNTLNERGFQVVALSGEHSQAERNHAMQSLRDGRARVCVATDVAARGIDLPSLSLVVHVETPRDAEALQHRSGRTGRAGKKGTAVLIVPYPRRRRVEMMLKGARIEAEWIATPTPDDIRAADHERLLTALLAPVEVDDEDRKLGARLMAEQSPEDIAAALVKIHRSRLPEPEELIDVRAPGAAPNKADAHRPGFDDILWFKMDIGRAHNADPRWLLPLLCRRGHITRNEVGAIRIAQNETRFQIPRALAPRFADAVRRTAGAEGEGEVTIIEAEGPPGPMDRGDHGANIRPDQRPRQIPRTGPGPRSGPPPARAIIKPYAGKPKGPRKPR